MHTFPCSKSTHLPLNDSSSAQGLWVSRSLEKHKYSSSNSDVIISTTMIWSTHYSNPTAVIHGSMSCRFTDWSRCRVLRATTAKMSADAQRCRRGASLTCCSSINRWFVFLACQPVAEEPLHNLTWFYYSRSTALPAATRMFSCKFTNKTPPPPNSLYLWKKWKSTCPDKFPLWKQRKPSWQLMFATEQGNHCVSFFEN